jgi:hypothetical protein
VLTLFADPTMTLRFFLWLRSLRLTFRPNLSRSEYSSKVLSPRVPFEIPCGYVMSLLAVLPVLIPCSSF